MRARMTSGRTDAARERAAELADGPRTPQGLAVEALVVRAAIAVAEGDFASAGETLLAPVLAGPDAAQAAFEVANGCLLARGDLGRAAAGLREEGRRLAPLPPAEPGSVNQATARMMTAARAACADARLRAVTDELAPHRLADAGAPRRAAAGGGAATPGAPPGGTDRELSGTSRSRCRPRTSTSSRRSRNCWRRRWSGGPAARSGTRPRRWRSPPPRTWPGGRAGRGAGAVPPGAVAAAAARLRPLQDHRGPGAARRGRRRAGPRDAVRRVADGAAGVRAARLHGCRGSDSLSRGRTSRWASGVGRGTRCGPRTRC